MLYAHSLLFLTIWTHKLSGVGTDKIHDQRRDGGNSRAMPESIDNIREVARTEPSAGMTVTSKLNQKSKERTVEELIKLFDAACQKNSTAMDTHCDDLLVNLKQQMKLALNISDREARRMIFVDTKFCGLDNPIVYNTSISICCNGRVLPKITGSEMCCGPKTYGGRLVIYDTREHLCCNAVPHKKSNKFLECCGRYVYDNRTLTGCCNGKLFDRNHKYCCNDKTLHHNIGRRNRHGHCCGTSNFDDRCYSCNHTSQSPTVYPVFDQRYQRCCHGRIKNIKNNRNVCCGRHLMNERKSICVDGLIIAKPTLRMKSFQETTKMTPSFSMPVTGTSFPDGETNFEEIDDNVQAVEQSQSVVIISTTGAILSVGISGGIFLIILHRRNKLKAKGSKKQLNLNNSDLKVTFENNPILSRSSSVLYENSCESGYHSLQPTSTCSERYTDLESIGQNSQNLETQTHLKACGENRIRIVDLSSDIHSTGPDLDTQFSFSPIVENDSPWFLHEAQNVDVCWEKPLQNNDVNLLSGLFTNTETQTVESKENNQRDIFGRPYEYSCDLDTFNRTLQWEKSDSKMTLPLSAVDVHTVHAQASSFDDIPAIFEKFSFSKETNLVSPVVEYCLIGCTNLNDHALVELPLVTEQITEVLKFKSDGGMNQTVSTERIPVLEHEDFNYDVFCIVKNDRALIYTKMFSGFVCTRHGSRDNISMQAFLFGSYKKVMQNHEIRLSLYIADELHRFRDYNRRMFGNEESEGRKKEAEKMLQLPDCALREDDYLEINATVTGDSSDIWEHKLHPKIDRQIEPETKVVKLKDLSRCCQSDKALPYQMGWWFINKNQAMPTYVVQSVVDIECILIDQRASPTRTPLIIDEMKLRESDRSEILEETQKLAALKQYLFHDMEIEKKAELACKLKDAMKRTDKEFPAGNSLEQVLDYMERNMTSTVCICMIADALQQMREYHVLDTLIQRKYIPQHALPMPVHPCTVTPSYHSEGDACNWQMKPDIPSENAQSVIYRRECRAEIGQTLPSSYDNMHSRITGNLLPPVTAPRPEIRNTVNCYSDSEPKALQETNSHAVNDLQITVSRLDSWVQSTTDSESDTELKTVDNRKPEYKVEPKTKHLDDREFQLKLADSDKEGKTIDDSVTKEDLNFQHIVFDCMQLDNTIVEGNSFNKDTNQNDTINIALTADTVPRHEILKLANSQLKTEPKDLHETNKHNTVNDQQITMPKLDPETHVTTEDSESDTQLNPLNDEKAGNSRTDNLEAVPALKSKRQNMKKNSEMKSADLDFDTEQKALNDVTVSNIVDQHTVSDRLPLTNDTSEERNSNVETPYMITSNFIDIPRNGMSEPRPAFQNVADNLSDSETNPIQGNNEVSIPNDQKGV